MKLYVIHLMLLSAKMTHRSILLILSTFEGVLITRKHSSVLRIKAKHILAFNHVLTLFFGSFLLLARRSAVCKKKLLHSLFIPPKHENTSSVSLEVFAGYTFFSSHFQSFYEQLEDCEPHLANGLKSLRHESRLPVNPQPSS